MASDGEFDTSRVAVKTYVPAYQKSRWADHADELDMSQSEFVRTMVQAGRRKFDVVEEGGSDASNPRGHDLDDRVLDIVEEEGPLSFDDLVETMTEDLERRIEAAIESLQDANEIRHSPRKGYGLAEGSR